MTRPPFEVADIVRQHGERFLETHPHSGVNRLLLLHDPCSDGPPRRERTCTGR